MADESNGEGGLSASQKRHGMALLFEDPITFELMENATITKCGHTFGSTTIKPYVETHKKCPLCAHALSVSDLTTDYKLNEAIQQYRLYLKEGGSASASLPTEEELTSLTIPLSISTEELNRQINPNYKSPLDDYKLIVDVIHASGLANQQRRGMSNPYCTVQFGNRMQKTSVAKSNLNPRWKECFIFDVKEEKTEEDDYIGLVKYEEHPALIVDVWDSCKLGKDKFMGRATASWDEIQQHKNQILKESYTLKYHNFKKETKKQKQKEPGPPTKHTKKSSKSQKKRPMISGVLKLRICYANLRKLKTNQADEQARVPRGSIILKVVEEGCKSEEENSTSLEEVEGRNPYDVRCPYDGCGSYMAAYLLPPHVVNTHANDANQKHSCPVCQFIMGSQWNYTVTNDTNLLQHLRQVHASDLGNTA